MSVRVSPNSRLIFGELLTDASGATFWDLTRLPTLEVQTDDLQYTVQSSDRLDTLAARFYGSSNLQWVLAHANGIELWPTQLLPNQTLRIPSARYVLQVWLAQARPRTR